MELDAVECLEAYGLIRGTKKCSVLFEDYYECHNKTKQMQRVMVSLFFDLFFSYLQLYSMLRFSGYDERKGKANQGRETEGRR